LKILVTGGAGFLGQHLVKALQERGDAVRVLDQPSERSSQLARRGVIVFHGDIRDPTALTEPVRGVDAVLHLAAMSGVWRPMSDYCAVNVKGTENVCRAVLDAGVKRLVHISSWTVYGMGIGQPARENFAFKPLREPYSLSKVIGDKLVQRMIARDGLPAVIIRPDTIFGPGDQQHIGRLADRLRAGRFIIVGSGRNAVPFIYVTDVVQGLMLALDHPRAVGNAYNIANDSPLTQEELLYAIADQVGARRPRIHVPYAALSAAAHVAEKTAQLARSTRKPILTRIGVSIFGADNRHSIDKARRELDYSPRMPLSEGISLATAWYRDQRASGGLAVPAGG
jgi:nucleoside-diphosphate-sugar epimerase